MQKYILIVLLLVLGCSQEGEKSNNSNNLGQPTEQEMKDLTLLVFSLANEDIKNINIFINKMLVKNTYEIEQLYEDFKSFSDEIIIRNTRILKDINRIKNEDLRVLLAQMLCAPMIHIDRTMDQFEKRLSVRSR